jgi:3-oxoacyl-(acyl-carrier-protein) synthase
MNKKRVVVTGMGVVSPNAVGLDNFETALRDGKSGIRFIPKLEELKFSCRIGGLPENFEAAAEQWFTGPDLNYFTGNLGYASVAALEAWRNAGLSLPEETNDPDWDTGTIFGCGICDMETIAGRVVPMISAGNVRRLGTQVIERVMGSGVSAVISGLLGLGNQATSNSSACSTGTEAVADAAQRIRAGLARRMVAGGSEGYSPYTWGGFDAMRVLSRKFNDDPEKGSRPMSASAGGFVPGAGAGALVLEDLETALARGARIYAEIAGAMVNCGGQRGGGTMTAPNPQGIIRCIRGAMADAGVHAADIDLVSGHLTATFADPSEVKSWSNALQRGPDNFPHINATKSMIGHCLGAAGAIETVAAILQLHGGFLHPSLNCEDVHPDIASFAHRIPRACMDDPALETVAKASFGFGDVNSCLIIRKWKKQP